MGVELRGRHQDDHRSCNDLDLVGVGRRESLVEWGAEKTGVREGLRQCLVQQADADLAGLGVVKNGVEAEEHRHLDEERQTR